MRESNEAERWLEQAEDDLRWAAHLRDAGANNIACFLSQQVAEKALKALLYHSGEELVVGHSVQDLCERAAQKWGEIAQRCPGWGTLDAFYIPTRYPDALPGSIPARVYDQSVAIRAVAVATEVVEAARAILAPANRESPS
jgi:HEPN domain-containing protein